MRSNDIPSISNHSDQLAESIDKALVQQVVIQGQAGNDTLVSQSSIPAVIEGGAGNDRIELASKQRIIDGGSGTDSLGRIAALDALNAATSIETVNGKRISSWLPTVQDAGTSRYGGDDSREYNGSGATNPSRSLAVRLFMPRASRGIVLRRVEID